MIFPFSSAPSPITRERVYCRTRELAAQAGRPPPHVTQRDYEQARREVTGESDRERQDALLDARP
jgi:hypothetical protein